jgi:hypothetical protein
MSKEVENINDAMGYDIQSTASSCEFGENGARTSLDRDTPLTQPCSLDVRAHVDALHALRERHGDDSVVGRHCTNLMSQLRNLPGYIRPAWATFESQTLPGSIRWQMAQLEAALLEARRFRSDS